MLQANEVVDSVSALDLADRVWSRLCLERDAARQEVSECMRATESGSLDSYKQLKQARHRARTAEDVMLRFLDLLDDSHAAGLPLHASSV